MTHIKKEAATWLMRELENGKSLCHNLEKGRSFADLKMNAIVPKCRSRKEMGQIIKTCGKDLEKTNAHQDEYEEKNPQGIDICVPSTALN